MSVFGWFGGRLDNGGERIALRRPTGEILFSLDYRDDFGWPSQVDGAGFSMEIVDPSGDPDAPGNWQATAYLGTPGTLGAGPIPPGPVQLSEVMAANLSAVPNAGTYADWIELHNSSASPVSLAGWSLTDDANARKYVFPPGTVIDEGSYFTVWCDTNTTLPGLHTGFALDRAGETVILYNASTGQVDAVSFGPQVFDLSLGRVNGDWTLTLPTFTAPNTPAPTADLVECVRERVDGECRAWRIGLGGAVQCGHTSGLITWGSVDVQQQCPRNPFTVLHRTPGALDVLCGRVAGCGSLGFQAVGNWRHRRVLRRPVGGAGPSDVRAAR